MSLKFQKLTPTAKLPTKGSEHSAGYDLYVDDIKVGDQDGTYLVKYGVAVEIPEGCVGLLIERSSFHKKGLSISNKVGVIDSDYRGELMSPVHIFGNVDARLEIGDRIAQLVIVQHFNGTPEWADELTETGRGENGFGSTGER